MLQPSRYSQSTLVIISAVVLCIMALGIVAGVVALNLRNRPPRVLKVPDDFPSIQAAIDAADPADIVQVRAGTYNENITIGKPITLLAESFDQTNAFNNPTILDGMGGEFTILIPAGLTQMPAIRGFVIQNSSDGIRASSAAVIEFNYLRSANHLINYQLGGGGINRGNVFFASVDDAIHIDTPNWPLVIEYNRILYAGDDGIEINLQNTGIPTAPTETQIRNNMIIGSGEDGIQFVDFTSDPLDPNRRFVIAWNLIANSTKAGLGLMPSANTVEDFSGADVVETIRIFNNTFYGNNHGISGGDNLVAINNIIVNSGGRGVWRVQGGQGSTSIVAYTLFYNNILDADQSSLGAGLITGQDPLFQAAPNPGPDGTWTTVDDDFTGLVLQAGSPAIDKAIPQYLAVNGESVPPAPITGFAGAAPDLGWREYGSPAFVTPTATLPPSPTLPPGVVPPSPLPSVTLTFAPTSTASPPPTPTLPPTMTATLVTPPSLPPTLTPTTTPPSTATMPGTATAPLLSISDIEPRSAQAGTTASLTIAGTGFVNGTQVIFEGGQGVVPEVTTVQVLTGTTMRVTVNARADASFGTQAWDVRVTNPNGSSAILVDAFTVIP